MATLHIAEFQTVGGGGNFVISAPLVPPLNEQRVEITGQSVQSKPFHENTNFIRVVPKAPCSVAFGIDPEATTNNMPLAAGGDYFFSVGPRTKLAVISNA